MVTVSTKHHFRSIQQGYSDHPGYVYQVRWQEGLDWYHHGMLHAVAFGAQKEVEVCETKMPGRSVLEQVVRLAAFAT